MKKAVILVAAALLATAAPAWAGVRIGLLGGYALTPSANLGQGAAYGAQVSFDFAPNFAVEIGAFRFQVPVASSGSGLSKGTLAVVPIEIDLKVHFPVLAKLELFAAAGGGVYWPQYTQDAAAAQAWTAVGFAISQKLDITFGFHLRGGLEMAISKGIGLVLEARYANVSANGTWTLTDILGGPSLTGKFTGLSLDTVVFGLGLNFAL